MSRPISLIISAAIVTAHVAMTPVTWAQRSSTMDQFKRALSGGTGPAKTKSKAAPKAAAKAANKPAASAPAAAAPKMSGEAVVLTFRFNDVAETVAIKLRPDLAPQTVAAFRQLVQSGFYQGLAVHRAVPNYLIQMGDPTSRDEAARLSWGTTDNGQPLAIEAKGANKRAMVAMARRPDQKDSSGSQFYILLKDAPSLDGQYTVFGEVISGLDVVSRISGTVADENDVPVRRVEVSSTQLMKAEDVVVAKPKEGTLKRTKSDAEKGFVDRMMERFW